MTGVPGGPTPTGDVDFEVYGPTDATCTGTPVFTSVDRPLTGGIATSASFTPTTVGTYRVIARYNGDANYDPVSGACGDMGEQVVVSPTTPVIATQVNDATIDLGDSFTDTATVTGEPGFPTPTGTVTFRIYGPTDATCTGTPVFTSANRPLTGGTATSAPFTPTAIGTYRVIARYNGDANYDPVAGVCGDTGEQVVVSPATPTIATQVNDATIDLGDSFTDTATVTGFAGGPTPTGDVDFEVYGPNNATCTGAPVFTSVDRPLDGWYGDVGVVHADGDRDLRVIARYSGDANYDPVSGVCGDTGEQVVVGPATPASRRRSTTRRSTSVARSRIRRRSPVCPVARPRPATSTSRSTARPTRRARVRPCSRRRSPADRWHRDLGPVHAGRGGHISRDRALQRRRELRPGLRCLCVTRVSRSSCRRPRR